jgi:hypothetical protein
MEEADKRFECIWSIDLWNFIWKVVRTHIFFIDAEHPLEINISASKQNNLSKLIKIQSFHRV